MVEFYQLNRGSLSTRLTHYIVSLESAMTNGDAVSQKKAISCSDPEVNIKSNIKHNQNLSLDSDPSENVSPPSGTEASSIIAESDAKILQNGSLKSPDEVRSSRETPGPITPER